MLPLLALIEVERKLSFGGLTVTESMNLNCTTDSLNQPSELSSITANSIDIYFTLRQCLTSLNKSRKGSGMPVKL